MNALDFCYWLQGFFEITGKGKILGNSDLTAEQVMMIRKHLQSVFTDTIMTTTVEKQLITDEEAKKIEEYTKKLTEMLGRKKTDKSIFDFEGHPLGSPFDYKRQIAVC